MDAIDKFGVQATQVPPEVTAYLQDHAAELLADVLRQAIGGAIRVSADGTVEIDWQMVLEGLYHAHAQPFPAYRGDPDTSEFVISLTQDDSWPKLRRYERGERISAAANLKASA